MHLGRCFYLPCHERQWRDFDYLPSSDISGVEWTSALPMAFNSFWLSKKSCWDHLKERELLCMMLYSCPLNFKIWFSVYQKLHCVCRIHQRFLLRVITICLIVRVRIFAGTKPKICQIVVQLRFYIIAIIQLVLTTLSQKFPSTLSALSSVFVVFLFLPAS